MELKNAFVIFIGNIPESPLIRVIASKHDNQEILIRVISNLTWIQVVSYWKSNHVEFSHHVKARRNFSFLV